MGIFLLINWFLCLGIKIVQLRELLVTKLVKVRLLQGLSELHCSLHSLHPRVVFRGQLHISEVKLRFSSHQTYNILTAQASMKS